MNMSSISSILSFDSASSEETMICLDERDPEVVHLQTSMANIMWRFSRIKNPAQEQQFCTLMIEYLCFTQHTLIDLSDYELFLKQTLENYVNSIFCKQVFDKMQETPGMTTMNDHFARKLLNTIADKINEVTRMKAIKHDAEYLKIRGQKIHIHDDDVDEVFGLQLNFALGSFINFAGTGMRLMCFVFYEPFQLVDCVGLVLPLMYHIWAVYFWFSKREVLETLPWLLHASLLLLELILNILEITIIWQAQLGIAVTYAIGWIYWIFPTRKTYLDIIMTFSLPSVVASLSEFCWLFDSESGALLALTMLTFAKLGLFLDAFRLLARLWVDTSLADESTESMESDELHLIDY